MIREKTAINKTSSLKGIIGFYAMAGLVFAAVPAAYPSGLPAENSIGCATVAASKTKVETRPCQAPDQAGLRNIADWLYTQYPFSVEYRPPRIIFLTEYMMSRLNRPAGHAPDGNMVAGYDDRGETIYLLNTWTGTTAVEQSILVHEMTHHLQNLQGLKFSCQAERESIAYAAQEKWLARRGYDMMTEFDMDPFTVLARTLCIY